MPDLLLELATEELPARFIQKALEDLKKCATKDLERHALPAGAVQVAGTPRRLTIHLSGLPDRQPDRVEEKAGPAKQVAFKDGQPTIAATKFAESFGLSIDEVEIREVTKKGKTREVLWASRNIPGKSALEVLAERIPTWIDGISFKKSMRWIEGSRIRFGRPLRRITALLGDALGAEVVPLQWGNLRAGRQVSGHRFLHPELLDLPNAVWADYCKLLADHHVIVDSAARRTKIEKGLGPVLGDAGLATYAGLLNEVINLVEWPDVDVGTFHERFLSLPDIVIVEAMTGHQRYFPVRRKSGELDNRFAYVANRPLHPVIRDGNERVLDARLSDSIFFYELDQKTPLEDRVCDLAPIVFMEGLGSYLDRIPRVAELALEVAKAAGWCPEDATLPTEATGTRITRSLGKGGPLALHIHLAARLARADLTTEVVGEFPELQGQMGAIYAAQQGQPAEVACAIREHYLPRGDGDDLPESQVGICLALADKLDTIVSAWATGNAPTGSGDPFMVRRNALGVLRILREREVDLGVDRLLRAAVLGLPDKSRTATLEDEIKGFFRDRLEIMAKKEKRNHLQTRACLSAGRDASNVLDFWRRLDALGELSEHTRFAKLCELVDRTRTITAKNGPDVDPDDIDTSRLEHDAEKALLTAYEGCRDEVRQAIEAGRYVEAGRRYVEDLADATHTFFEPAPVGVFVMHEDLRLRTNRLALLKRIHALLAMGFADLAEVAAK
ncbi:MAG: glycine--tRNA ligase subunit beta [Planctomycetes bacterium]|nr:glycine--tRNA ligase subunit beta [Planctomycetota bacterium]